MPTIPSIRKCTIRNTHLFFVDFYKSSIPHRLGDFVGSSLECASLLAGLDYHDGFPTGSSLCRCGSFLGSRLGLFCWRFCHCFLCRLLSLGGCLFRCRRCGACRTTRRSSSAYHYARQMLLQWKSVMKKRSSWLGVLDFVAYAVNPLCDLCLFWLRQAQQRQDLSRSNWVIRVCQSSFGGTKKLNRQMTDRDSSMSKYF